MGKLVENGLYKIKQKYFEDFERKGWVDNKNENRPYYFVFEDSMGINWVIPMSTQVENYKEKIYKEEEKRGKGNCLYYHIGEIASEERVFLIGDMFPVTEEYIAGEWTLKGKHYIVKDAKLKSEVRSKAMRYLRLLEQGVMKSRNDVLCIRSELTGR